VRVGSSAPHGVIVSPNPVAGPGGVERTAGLVARVLKQHGWRVSIVCPAGGPSRWIYRAGLGSLWLSRSAARATAAGERPDLIVTNGFLGAGFPRDIPRVHVYHGTMVRGSLSVRAWMPRRELARRVVGGGVAEALSARSATVVCVSDSAATEVRRYYRVRADLILPNAIDPALFRPIPRAEARAVLGLPEDQKIALFAGRPDRVKGFELVAGGARRAGYALAVAGPGDAAATHHLGVLPPGELAHAYCAADAVVLPSSYEACSYVVLETLACGVPLIATRVGWMTNLLAAHPAYDRLCVRPDEAEVADRLIRLSELAAPELISQVREWVVAYHNIDRYAVSWANLLSGVAGVPRHSRRLEASHAPAALPRRAPASSIEPSTGTSIPDQPPPRGGRLC
jgi:glycosyltransferase involved in cell wall biosynthesis